MTAAVIERFADAHCPLRALVIGEEWASFMSPTSMILTPLSSGQDQLPRRLPERRRPDRSQVWQGNRAYLEEGRRAYTLSRPSRQRHAERIEHRSDRTSVMVWFQRQPEPSQRLWR